jgi:tetratricopeptide (TPR) repeat protein
LLLFVFGAIWWGQYLQIKVADWLGVGLVLLALALTVPISALIHELGHALMGWLCGFVVTSFGLWPGRHNLIVRWRKTRIFIGTNWRRPGLTLSVPARITPGCWRWIGLLSGGVFANLCVACFGFVTWVYLGRPGYILLIFACVNALGVLNFSDGLQILRALRGVPLTHPVLPGILLLKQMRPLLEDIGDRVFLAHLCAFAAQEATALQMTRYASSLIAEAEQAIENQPPLSLAILALAKSCLHNQEGNRGVRDDELGRAQQLFHENRDAGGLLIVACARAEFRYSDGDPKSAIADLDELLLDPMVSREANLRRILSAQRWLARVDSASEDMDKLAEEFARDQSGRSASISDMAVWNAIGRYHAKRQDWSRAYECYRQGIKVGKEAHAALADRALQREFEEAQAGFIADMNECVEQLGMPAVVEPFQESVVAQKEREEVLLALKLQKSKRWLIRAGFVAILDLVGLVALFAFVVLDAILGPHEAARPPLGSFSIIIFVAIASHFVLGFFTLFVSCVYLVLGRTGPRARPGFGQTIFVLVSCPWPITILVSIVDWLGIPLP